MFPLAILAGSNFFNDIFSIARIVELFERAAANPLTTALVGGAIWFRIMFVSYKVSVSIFQKREF